MEQMGALKMHHTFAKRVFLVAGIYGLAALLPQYFMEKKLGQQFPPSITHPEQFYGFIGVAVAWQFAFLLIASDVERYRLFMLPAILEKLSFGIPVLVLFAQGRVAPPVVFVGLIDLVLALFFFVAFRMTRTRLQPSVLAHSAAMTDRENQSANERSARL
jgi:hypothetical protein